MIHSYLIEGLRGDRYLRFPAHAELLKLLEFDGQRTVLKVEEAIAEAMQGRKASALRCRSDDCEVGMLIAVRPGREDHSAVITVSELDAPRHGLDWQQMVDIFDTTRAEGEIAIAWLDGFDLADMARMRGVSVDTVRKQVKSLMRKVGVRNQRKLSNVLAQVAIAVPQ